MELRKRLEIVHLDIGQQRRPHHTGIMHDMRECEARGDVGSGLRVAAASIRSTSTVCSFACDCGGLRRASDTTSYPASSICRQISQPMPVEPPVTRATFGASFAPPATSARTRSGLPEPCLIFSGAAMMTAPLGGSRSRLVRHCSPNRPLPCM